MGAAITTDNPPRTGEIGDPGIARRTESRRRGPIGALLVSPAPLMARKPLRSQLNQVRAWVRQGRTDAWIAHQLDVPAAELREFRRRHGLTPDGEEAGTEDDLRDEIEAEIEAAARAEDAATEGSEEEEAEEAEEPERGDGGEREQKEGEGEPRRRRRRRGRRGRGRKGAALQGTFDHGESDGFGLWLDPAIQDDPVYSEHWAGHRPVEVSIEPDRIVIKRT